MSPYARVAVPRPILETFLYRLPDALAAEAAPGCRVVVPFGRRELTGWIDELLDQPPARLPARVREIIDLPDSAPVLDPDLLKLCRWVSRYYAAPLGPTFRAALPAALTAESSERLGLAPLAATSDLSPLEGDLIEHLRRHRGPLKLSSVRKALGPGPWSRIAHRLADRGLLVIEYAAPTTAPPVKSRQVVTLSRRLPSLQDRESVFTRALRQRELYEYLESVGGSSEVSHVVESLGISRSVVHGLVAKGLATIEERSASENFLDQLPMSPEPVHEPTIAQAAAVGRLLEAAAAGRPGVFVLKGVTGSGKTLVYIEVLRELVTRQGRGAILLVPEISLTPQTLSRFRAAFGDSVALLHSALSAGERYAEWRSLRSGAKRIVIGARSAVFAPVRGLGAIIIDEEHESSYKQSDPAPRYHAREVAVARALRAGALCLLGSATPSLEAWHHAASGEWQLIELPERIGARPLPAVRVVDLRRGANRTGSEGNGRPGGPAILSDPLRHALEDRLRRRQQAILLLNRRGYSNFVQCRDCGSVRGCWQCNVSLTQHRRPPRLVCHYCYYQEPPPERCSECGSIDIQLRGVGTEQVERVLGEVFPAARVARMDVDTTSGKWSHHQILGRVARGEVDILLGTQMIAKGLDFPNVTLVGVINADVGLSLPDFRASERSFQLLTQVAGRAGRGPIGGEVIIQTSLPDHYAVRFAVEHDYLGFAARELSERSEPGYPPHTTLANIVISGPGALVVQEAAESAFRWLDGLRRARNITGLGLLGPAPCPIDRVRGRWRWHLILRATEPGPLGHVIRYFARRFIPSGGDLRVEIDRDPVSLL